MRKRLLVFGTVVLVAASPSAISGTVLGNGGATEVTQIMNNVELLTLNGQQATQVAESVKQTMTQINQYASMVKNLQQLDPSKAVANLAPYQQQAADLQKILSNVTAISQQSKQLSGMLNGNVQDMAAMNMNPSQYLNWMMTQSQNKQGAYTQQLQQEMGAISAFQQRYEALQKLQQDIPGIDGQVKGLQSLNQTMGMATGELMDLRLVVQQQQTAMTQQKVVDSASVVAREQKGAQDAQANSDALGQFGDSFKGGKVWK